MFIVRNMLRCRKADPARIYVAICVQSSLKLEDRGIVGPLVTMPHRSSKIKVGMGELLLFKVEKGIFLNGMDVEQFFHGPIAQSSSGLHMVRTVKGNPGSANGAPLAPLMQSAMLKVSRSKNGTLFL